MPRYTFRFMAGDRIEHTEEYDLDSDRAARDLAHAVGTETSVEVWERERFVGRITPPDATRYP